MRRALHILVPMGVLLGGWTAGCGGRVDGTGASPTPGTTGTGTVTAPTTTTSPIPTPTSTPSPTTTSTTTPVPPDPLLCSRTSDRAKVTWATVGTKPVSCEDLKGSNFEITGAVTRISADSISVDPCPPGADCFADGTVTLRVSAARLRLDTLKLTTGDFVHVKLNFSAGSGGWACGTHLQIDSLASWLGVKSPSSRGDVSLLTVDDAKRAPGPIKVSASLVLGCETPTAAGCSVSSPAGSYEFLVGASRQKVRMGTSTLVYDKGNTFEFHNLRSYESGYCDDLLNFAYWMMLGDGLD